MTTTSGGALLLEAVVPQLAVVLLSLPLKSCGWDLTDVSSARVTAKSSRRPLKLQVGVHSRLYSRMMGRLSDTIFDNPALGASRHGPGVLHQWVLTRPFPCLLDDLGHLTQC